MPKEKTITLFSYDELQPKIQEKVLERLRYTNVDFDQWDDYIIEDWQDEKLPALGFDDAKISYSGFCSQGDGASFTAKVNILTWLKVNKNLKQNKELVKFLKNESESCYIEINVVRSSRQYSHEYTVSIESDGHLYDNVPDKVTKQVDDLNPAILQNVHEISRMIYRELEKDYIYQTSDKAIIEAIKLNEWTFRENGVTENL